MPDKIKLGPDWNSRVKDRIAEIRKNEAMIREDLALAVEAAPGTIIKLGYDMVRDSPPMLDQARFYINNQMSIERVMLVLEQLLEVREA